MLKNIRKRLISSGVRNSAVASQPCPLGHIIVDKRLQCYASSPKLFGNFFYPRNVIRNSEPFPKQKYLYKPLILYNNIKEVTL